MIKLYIKFPNFILIYFSLNKQIFNSKNNCFKISQLKIEK